jgi:hypothetical protein
VAWCVEGVLACAGVWLYLRAVKLTLARKVTLIAVMSLVMAMTVVGQARQAPPPTPAQMALSSLITIALLVLLSVWIDRCPDRDERIKP